MSSGELQALFMNLRPRSQASNSASSVPTARSQQPSRPISTTLHPEQISTVPPPPFPGAVDEDRAEMDQSTSQPRATSSATAQNLLNLLNFGPSSSNANSSAQSPWPTNATPNPSRNGNGPVSASDLVARFMSPTVTTPKLETRDSTSAVPQSESVSSREQLLGLLNKQAQKLAEPMVNNEPEALEEPVSSADVPMQSIEQPDDAVPEYMSEKPVDTADNLEVEPSKLSKSASPLPEDQKPIFTYTNPFEALNASRQETPKAPNTNAQSHSPPTKFEFQTGPGLSSTATISARKKLTPRLRSQRSSTPANTEQTPTMPESQQKVTVSPLEISKSEAVQPKVETPAAAQSIEIDPSELRNAQSAPHQDAVPDEPPNDVQDEGSADWEDAEDSPDKAVTIREVPVYNFPIKAFVSITLQLGATSDIGIREDSVMEISRLKKDFDQLDRSLAAATSKYITYAFVKNGGMRIIRQDDGSDRHVFKNSHDRIFNVAFCTNAVHAIPSNNQAVLGTGISGAVYYANVTKEGNDLFEKNQLEADSLIFPPFPQADENTAGGVLKTRAKKSSRHPEYFAIGRGKSIHMIWPATAFSPRYGINETNHVVDVEKFYTDRPLHISTGKAGKDFTFSEDDTMIVSLDKTGRLRFWDITALVDEANATAVRVDPVIVDTPILSLSTASPAEKSWPTSVTFVDKARPYKKGGALRYVLVGLRQNHTLQLWDIALGKAVQEVNFPHENEVDGICSVGYHPETGIIVVGHPTRNSIFFIHLSAPRYSLSSQISQASYVQRIAAKDPELPKPDSTACMSGIRELSFADKGELRSVELLSIQKSSGSAKDESSSLFELYIVHSRGVTCLGINREDLGWNEENKVMYPVDAHKQGLVSLKELKLGSVIEEPTRSKSPVKEASQPSKAAKKKAKKAGQAVEDAVNGVENNQQPNNAIPVSTTAPAPTSLPVNVTTSAPEPTTQEIPPPKETKKAKKKADKVVQQAEAPEQMVSEPQVMRSISPVKPSAVQANGLRTEPVQAMDTIKPEVLAVGMSEEQLNKELKRIESSVSGNFKNELDSLYRNIQSDRAAQDSSSASRQEAILRLVSSSLSTNVEKSLSRILAQQMQQAVVPSMVQHTSVQIAETMSQNLAQMLPHEVSTQIPAAINSALQNPQMSRSIADSVSQKLSQQLESQLHDLLLKTVTPVFKNIAHSAAEKAISETEVRLSAQMRQLQIERATQDEKLDQLTHLLQGMAGTMQAMSDTQVAFQTQILRERQTMALTGPSSTAVSTSRQVSTARDTPDPTPIAKPKPIRIRSKADIELEEITNLMNQGRYEEGSIKWLHSTQPVKLFDELFVRFTPEYLATDVSPLVAFSVAVTLANSLVTNTERRLEWISAAFDAVDLQDSEIADLAQHAPGLLTSLIQKLESLYMTTAERDLSDPVLKSIPTVARKGREMKAALVARASNSTGSVLPQLTAGAY